MNIVAPRFDYLNYEIEYRAWAGMTSRCTNKNERTYKHYGDRGITVCKRWRESFPAFLKDMGRKPSPELSLDRIDNDGNYEPGNCRWATAKQQANNKRPGMTGRPRLYHNPERLSLVLPASLHKRIEKHAKEGHRSLSATVVEILEKALGK